MGKDSKTNKVKGMLRQAQQTKVK